MKKLWNSTFSIAAPLVLLALFAGSAQTCLAATPGHDSSQVTPGPGIPPALREKIFRLYFTTKQRGSGIGLAMAFRTVQLHDGTIDFTSEPGKGTAFFIRLPIAV